MVIESKEFEQPALQSFIADVPPAKTHRLTNAFPVEEVEDIKSAYDLVTQNKIVAGSIIGFNAGTPVRTKGDAEQAIAELTKIAHAHYLTEDDMYKFHNPRNEAERQRIIDNALVSTGDLSQGIDDVKEFIRAGLAYRGEFNYVDERDNVSVKFKLERPEGNDITVSNPWSDPETSTPLDDIETAIRQFKETNGKKKPDYLVMNETTYAAFKRSNQVKDEFVVANGNRPRIVRDDDVTELFQSNGYPTLEIEEDYTTFERKDGSTYDVEHLEDGKVVLHAALMGSTLSGPAADNNFQKGKFAYSKQDQDPIGEKTVVGEVTLPVSKNYNGNVIVDVFGTEEEDNNDDEEDTP